MFLLLLACQGNKGVDLGADGTPCTTSTWYLDADGDGYGLEADTQEACDAPKGYADTPGDCDDADATISPGAEETCNGYDDDCDNRADDEDPMAYGSRTWYWDEDLDGWGREDSTAFACTAPEHYAAEPGDCEDEDPAVHPYALDQCEDGIDADCDGEDPTC